MEIFSGFVDMFTTISFKIVTKIFWSTICDIQFRRGRGFRVVEYEEKCGTSFNCSGKFNRHFAETSCRRGCCVMTAAYGTNLEN